MDPRPTTPPARLIALAGVAGSGKSTAADILVGEDPQGSTVRVKFADPLKAMLTSLYETAGYDALEIHFRLEGHLKELPCPVLGGQSPRFAMQTLGTEWGRDTISPRLWLCLWQTTVRRKMDAGFSVVVDDLRFPNEASLVRSMGGSVLLVERHDRLRAYTHISEDFNFKVDATVENKGTLENLRANLWAALED